MSPGNGLVKLQKVMERYLQPFVFSISKTNYFFKIAFQIGY